MCWDYCINQKNTCSANDISVEAAERLLCATKRKEQLAEPEVQGAA
jgi:hypothetical protein